jgi:hypothetical protein
MEADIPRMEKIDGIEQHLQSSVGEHFDKCQTSF